MSTDYRYRNKEWLFHQYIDLKKSMNEIAKICNASYNTIRDWSIKFKIQIRSKSESKKDKKQSEEHIKKRVESIKKTYQEHPEKIEERSDENSWNWKGDNVGKRAIHYRIEKHKIKTGICNICKKPENYKGLGKLQLSNLSGEYKMNLDDWQWAHCKCHKNWDIKNKIHNKKKKGDKKYWLKKIHQNTL